MASIEYLEVIDLEFNADIMYVPWTGADDTTHLFSLLAQLLALRMQPGDLADSARDAVISRRTPTLIASTAERGRAAYGRRGRP
jgi:hypothetical protein